MCSSVCDARAHSLIILRCLAPPGQGERKRLGAGVVTFELQEQESAGKDGQRMSQGSQSTMGKP